MINSKQLFQDIFTELSIIYTQEEARELAFTLLGHFANMSKSDVLANKQFLLNDKTAFNNALKRLKNHEPIQHIINIVEFCGLNLTVNQHVLIPRPETEELIYLISDDLKIQTNINVVDFGTGSGCIAIALKKQNSNLQVFAVDISENALMVATHNAEINLTDVKFVKANLLEKSTLEFLPKLHVIVSNPPYILPSEKSEMSKNVLNFEPHLALFVPENDPLLFYNAILEIAAEKLLPNGTIYFEINQLMGEAIKNLFIKHHYQNIRIIKDMFGKDRFVVAQKFV